MPLIVSSPSGIKFPSRFVTIDSIQANRIAERFGSPVFLMDLPGLERRFHDFQSAVKSCYSNSIVAISYKTNPTIGLLQRLHRKSSWAEVISTEEFQLAKHLGVPINQIVFNGPGKHDDDLGAAVCGKCQINCDHMDEVLRIEKIAASLQMQAAIGIRLGLGLNGHFSRFGFALTSPLPESDACLVADYIHQSDHLRLSGVHSQPGTNIRNLEKFSRQAEDLASFAVFLKNRHSIELQWINVGGGLAGIAPEKDAANQTLLLPSVTEYAAAVTGPLQAYLKSCQIPPKLFFEPGRTIFEPYGGLLTTVLGRRPGKGSVNSAAICDAGISSLSLANRFDFPVHVCQAETSHSQADCDSNRNSLDLFGPTCMQRDCLGKLEQSSEVKIGDRVIFFGVGGYGLSTASSFIKHRPGVVAWLEDDEFAWLRKPETLEHQLMLQSIIN